MAVKRTLQEEFSHLLIEYFSNSLCGFYLFSGRQDHHDAVEEDGDDDDEGEEGVDEDVDGHPEDGR